MNQEQQREAQNVPEHPEDNGGDLSIPAKKQRIVEEEEKDGGMHCPREIVTAGMDQKELQIRQNEILENEIKQLNGQIEQMRLANNQLHEQNQALIKSETLAKSEIARLLELLNTCLQADRGEVGSAAHFFQIENAIGRNRVMIVSVQQKFILPLELNCELFGWLKALQQRRLLPELCRAIYAMERKNVKRKIDLIVWSHWEQGLRVSGPTVIQIGEFGTGDVVGCGVEMGSDCKLFYTKNGALGGEPIPLPSTFKEIELFPAATLCGTGCEIKAIFNLDDFKFDLSKYLSEQK